MGIGHTGTMPKHEKFKFGLVLGSPASLLPPVHNDIVWGILIPITVPAAAADIQPLALHIHIQCNQPRLRAKFLNMQFGGLKINSKSVPGCGSMSFDDLYPHTQLIEKPYYMYGWVSAKFSCFFVFFLTKAVISHDW